MINKDWVIRLGYFLGIFTVFLIIGGIIIKAQVTLPENIYNFVKTEATDKIEQQTKADFFYSATSTRTKGLDDYDITILKAKYEDTDRVITELNDIKNILKRIEKNTRK